MVNKKNAIFSLDVQQGITDYEHGLSVLVLLRLTMAIPCAGQ